jgi:hypothetical protein
MSEGVLPLAHTRDLDAALQLAPRAFDIEKFRNLGDAKTSNQLSLRSQVHD